MHSPLRWEGLFCLLNLYKYYFDILFHGFGKTTTKKYGKKSDLSYYHTTFVFKVLQTQIQENNSYQENLT